MFFAEQRRDVIARDTRLRHPPRSPVLFRVAEEGKRCLLLAARRRTKNRQMPTPYHTSPPFAQKAEQPESVVSKR
jgi:hypothetical protein